MVTNVLIDGWTSLSCFYLVCLEIQDSHLIPPTQTLDLASRIQPKQCKNQVGTFTKALDFFNVLARYADPAQFHSLARTYFVLLRRSRRVRLWETMIL